MATEQEKMLKGELYSAADPQLVAQRRQAHNLCQEYNSSCEEEQAQRQHLLSRLLGSLGTNVTIEPPFIVDYGTNIHLGSEVYLNVNCVILDCAQVEIGNGVLLGPGVHLYTATHPLDWQTRQLGLELAQPVGIGSDVWIGGGVIVCPGVTIGDRSVIGAGSVVTHDIPRGVLAVGNPCRVIRQLEA